MTAAALDHFFALLGEAQRVYFPDAFFRGHRNGRPLALGLAGLRCRHLRLRLPTQCLHLERIEVLGGPDAADITGAAQITLSSVYPGTEALLTQRRIFSAKPQSIGVHTLANRDEWVCLSWPEPQTIDRLCVHNRDDEWAWRAWSVVVEVSLDGAEWTVVHDQGARQAQLVDMVQGAARHADRPADECRLLHQCAEMLALLARSDHAGAKALLDAPDLAPWRSAIRQGFNTHWLGHWQRWWSGHGITRPFRYWSTDEARTYLARALELLADLRTLSPDVCFGFGFVLAHVRDGQLIPHDDDLDLIISFDHAGTPTLALGLARVETHLRALGYNVQGDHFSHRWVYKPGWNAVDVFVGLKEADGISWFPSARKNLAADDVFPPIEVDLLGQRCPVPRNPIRYLDTTYGPRWREPDADFRHPWDRTQFADIA